MGVKKNGMTILSGSLKKHWMRYCTEINLRVNPTDNRAIGLQNNLIKQLSTIDSLFVQPGFVFNREFGPAGMKFNSPSIMHLKFVNGYERKYHMGASRFRLIQHEINHINDMIEFERSMAGQDDELEDDALQK